MKTNPGVLIGFLEESFGAGIFSGRRGGRGGPAKRRFNIALGQGIGAPTREKRSMAASVFTCPTTRMKVQYLGTDEDDDVSDNEYEAIRCQACTGFHLVNRKTGRLLGQNEE